METEKITSIGGINIVRQPLLSFKVKNKNEEFDKIDILEMDELFTYIKKNQEQIKKQGKGSVNIPEYGLLWIGTDLKLLRLD